MNLAIGILIFIGLVGMILVVITTIDDQDGNP